MINNIRYFFSHPESLSVGLGFFTVSALFGTWVTRLPEIQDKLILSSSQLGIALLFLSVGGLLINPFSGWIMEKISTGKATFWGSVLQAISFMLPFFATDYFSLIMALFVVGVFNGFITVAVNAAAAVVESRFTRSIMSSCHGMFSIGGIVGAGSASIIAGFGISPLINMLLMVVLLLLMHVFMRPFLFRIPNNLIKAPLFALPSSPLIGLFLLSISIVLAEVTIIDWSGVYIQNALGASAFVTGLGFAGFSLTMAMGRFYGDTLVSRIGRRPIIVFGSLLGAFGLGLSALIPHEIVAILSFTLVGIGFSCIMPILFSASTKIDGISPATGVAVITTAAILGGLIGRPAIGLIADHYHLGTSLLFAGVLTLAGTAVALKIDWK